MAEHISSEIGLCKERHPKNDSGMVYREFYCPGCATMLDVEPTLKGSPILHDIEIALSKGRRFYLYLWVGIFCRGKQMRL